MRSRFVRGLICLVVLAGVAVSTGCSTTPAQARQRARTWQTDRDHMKREWDWLLGFEDPSALYDSSLPPYW